MATYKTYERSTQKVVVLGANGFLGQSLATFFEQGGWGLADEGEFNPSYIHRLPAGATLINCVGTRTSHLPDAISVNSSLPQKLAEIALVNSNRLIHFGSSAEYSSRGYGISEKSETRPTSVYGISKLEGTQNLLRLNRPENILE